MTSRNTLFCFAAVAAFTATSCASAGKTLGLTRQGPNEFNIITKAPLVVPPEYNLRPPKLGEVNIEEKYATAAARQALIGDIDDAEPSRGESVLMAKAGGNKADPAVRVMIDGQNSVERKNQGFADRVLFWKDGMAIDENGKALDPDEEARRMKAVQSATGGGKVQIQTRPGGAKLPGL